jgi:catechol 2,3-dioxygenase-like lactoylglutathione lyase family enzyme
MMTYQAAGPLGSDVAVTHILVVADPARSRDFWVDVLGAELYREYGGTSVVLRFAGTWLLLVSGGGPTADKPAVIFTPPADVNPDFYHWVGIFSGVMLWPAGLSADTDGFAH